MYDDDDDIDDESFILDNYLDIHTQHILFVFFFGLSLMYMYVLTKPKSNSRNYPCRNEDELIH
jgi:hypothetical protein